MAIIIPSSRIFDLDNNKVIDNKIDGVTYVKTNVADEELNIWESSSQLSTNTSSDVYTLEGVWDIISETERKRLYCTISNYKQIKTVTLNVDTSSINGWNNVIFEFSRTVTDNITSTSRGIRGKIKAAGANPIKPDLPRYNASQEQINSFGNLLFETFADISIAGGKTTPIVFDFARAVRIYLQTGQLVDGEWTNVSSELVYNTYGDSFSYYYLYQSNDKSTSTTIVSGNKNSAYSLPNNDLFTDSAKIDGKKLGTYVSEQIIENYKNGKETAEVLCSISNYYDEFGNQVKFDDGEDMFFNIYDVVVPTKYNSEGLDVPISQTADYMAKTFVVLGVEIFYDGAVWQRLTLQETGETVEIL